MSESKFKKKKNKKKKTLTLFIIIIIVNNHITLFALYLLPRICDCHTNSQFCVAYWSNFKYVISNVRLLIVQLLVVTDSVTILWP